MGVTPSRSLVYSACSGALRKGWNACFFLPYPCTQRSSPENMDSRPNNLHELFSRASTPPAQGSGFSQQSQQPQQPAPAPQQPAGPPPSSDLIDSLFQNIMPPQDQQQQQQSASLDAPQLNPETYQVVSAPISPAMPLTDELANSASSAPTSSTQTAAQDRQNSLLSLLNNPPGQPASRSSAAPSNAPPQQVPTPPGSSRSNMSPPTYPSQNDNINQKLLLEQLMGRYVHILQFNIRICLVFPYAIRPHCVFLSRPGHAVIGTCELILDCLQCYHQQAKLSRVSTEHPDGDGSVSFDQHLSTRRRLQILPQPS